MNRISPMKSSLLAFVLLGMVAAWAVTGKKPAQAPEPPCCREGLPPGKFSEKSLYTLNATWTADVGKEVTLDALRGRPQVMALFFTNCQHSCPLIVADMKAIEKALPMNVRSGVDFLLVSIDPERDTPEALRAFREKYELPIEHWSLLRGKPEDVKKLADLVGFRYYPGSNLQFAHSLLITVLNPDGEIVYQQSGIGNTRDDATAAILRMMKPKAKRAKEPARAELAAIAPLPLSREVVHPAPPSCPSPNSSAASVSATPPRSSSGRSSAPASF